MEARSVTDDPWWGEPKRRFATCAIDWWTWTLGFAWWGEAKQFQLHLGPLAITFNAWAEHSDNPDKAQPKGDDNA